MDKYYRIIMLNSAVHAHQVPLHHWLSHQAFHFGLVDLQATLVFAYFTTYSLHTALVVVSPLAWIIACKSILLGCSFSAPLWHP